MKLRNMGAIMGIMAARFAEKGIAPRDTEIHIAIMKFRNSGGTLDELIAHGRAVYEMGSEGRSASADEAIGAMPSSPQPHAAAGPNGNADEAGITSPAAAPFGAEEGHSSDADKATFGMPTSVPTSCERGGQKAVSDKATHRMPPARSYGHGDSHLYVNHPDSTLRRGDKGYFASANPNPRPKPVIVHKSMTPADLRAMADTRKQAAVTIMETLKIDGRAIGDWTIGEAMRVGRDKLCNGHILVAAAKYAREHYANVTDGSKVSDVLKVADLQRIIQQAAEAADAA